MKLLFDQNLSYKLTTVLADLYPGSNQVRQLGLDRAADDVIWNHAKADGFTIVTQDADFAERSRLQGAPPKVVWLRCGNRSAAEIEQILRRNHRLLQELDRTPALHWVEIYR
jgi:predicted nuclease of predicted toxin-antitoxin system